jgi:hypothetical protein
MGMGNLAEKRVQQQQITLATWGWGDVHWRYTAAPQLACSAWFHATVTFCKVVQDSLHSRSARDVLQYARRGRQVVRIILITRSIYMLRVNHMLCATHAVLFAA